MTRPDESNDQWLLGYKQGLTESSTVLLRMIDADLPVEAIRAVIDAWSRGERSGLFEGHLGTTGEPEIRLVDDWREKI